MTTKATRDVIDLSTRPVVSIDIDGGTIDNTTIGATVPDTGAFTALTGTNLTITNSADFTGSTVVGLQAFYADLAEYYRADKPYEPGTVLKIGGEFEVTATNEYNDPNVFGIVSSDPAIVMNQQAINEDGHWVAIVLVGRAPCLIEGPVKKGQRIIADYNGRGRAVEGYSGAIFGRALADDMETELRLVEVAVVAVK